MANPLYFYLENCNLKELLPEIDQMNCQVSFFEGRKFTLNGLENKLTYNEIVHLVWEKVKFEGGNGEEIISHLTALHLRGEAELEKHIWARLFTLIKRLFNSFQRNRELEEIHSVTSKIPHWYPYEKTAHEIWTLEKCKGLEIEQFGNAQKDTIINELSRLGWNVEEQDILCQDTIIKVRCPGPFLNINRDETLGVNWANQSDFYYSPEVAINRQLSAEEHFTQMIEGLKQTAPLWLKLREAMIPWYQEDHFSKAVMNTDTWQQNLAEINYVDLKVNHLESKITFICNAADKVTIRVNWFMVFNYLYRDACGPKRYCACHRGMKVKTEKEFSIEGDKPFETLLKPWENVDKELNFHLFVESLVLQGNRRSTGIFGCQIESDPLENIKPHLKTLETMMKLPKNSLTDLAINENYDELRDQLKKLKKKGGLQFHPDKAEGSNDLFQEFDGALKEVEKWVKDK